MPGTCSFKNVVLKPKMNRLYLIRKAFTGFSWFELNSDCTWYDRWLNSTNLSITGNCSISTISWVTLYVLARLHWSRDFISYTYIFLYSILFYVFKFPMSAFKYITAILLKIRVITFRSWGSHKGDINMDTTRARAKTTPDYSRLW